MSSDMNERPAGFRETPCSVDGHPCEGQGTDAECHVCHDGSRIMISVPVDGLAIVHEENRLLREEFAALRVRHCDYANGIAEAIGPGRLMRDTGEPARSDRAEIEELKRERNLLRQRVDDLKFTLGNHAGWFDRYKATASQRDLLHSALSDLAEGDCSYGDNCPDFGTRHGRCSSCAARKALSEVKT